MAFTQQRQFFDGLADEILQHILDLAMARDSPCYLDDPCPGVNRSLRTGFSNGYPPFLESPTGAKDPLFSSTGLRGKTPVHQRAPQSVHRKDWIAINSTNRRIRALGKVSFFRVKTMAMRTKLPLRIQRGDFTGFRMCPSDQILALSLIRDTVIIDPKEASPMTCLELPKVISAMPYLRRCTLLFGFRLVDGQDDVEWITAAFVLGGPVHLELQELMVGNGIRSSFKLEEAMGPAGTWARHWEDTK
ncbi:hypothetical protein LSUE1_G008506, partial [Lachnellula suecica]